MQSVVEMPEFIRCAKQLGISNDQRESIINMIASNPDLGDEIVGTGGMRKLRVASKGKGKSGGYRVITFFSGINIPVFMITIYAKNQKDNLTAKEKKVLKTLSTNIVKFYQREQNE